MTMNKELSRLTEEWALGEADVSFLEELVQRSKLEDYEKETLLTIIQEGLDYRLEETEDALDRAIETSQDDAYWQGFRDGKLAGNNIYR